MENNEINKLSFEEALNQLEIIVKELESGKDIAVISLTSVLNSKTLLNGTIFFIIIFLSIDNML